MRTTDFDFDVPPELIAQTPAPRRDASRLFVVHRNSGLFEHRQFLDLPQYVRPGDVLVLNDSRVIKARLRGVNATTGGQFELLLVEENRLNDWWVMLRPGKRAREGTQILLKQPDGAMASIHARVLQKNSEGHCRVVFEGTPNILEATQQLGEVPLPPYIERIGATNQSIDQERYQTVFAHLPGSVAAPTAGLHFTEEMLRQIRRSGVDICFVTLHVGLGTFAPVKSDELAAHVMHEERFEVSEKTARMINRAREAGRRIVAVGTTTLRVLETVATAEAGRIKPGAGRTRIFIHPPYPFKTVDALLTNFHLPCSTLVMLVSAFAAPGRTEGRNLTLSAYAEAVRKRYRFYSYGDAMFLV